MLYRAYRYCFYHFYAYGLKKWGEKSYPQHWAAFVVATFACINIESLLMIFETVSGIRVFSSAIVQNKLPRLIGIALIFWFHQLLFVQNGRYRSIFKEFSQERATEDQKKKRARYLGIYTLISVIGFFVSSWIYIAKP